MSTDFELCCIEATGFVRRLDDLGRIQIPKPLRERIGLEEGDPLAIFLGSEGEIILKRYQP